MTRRLSAMVTPPKTTRTRRRLSSQRNPWSNEGEAAWPINTSSRAGFILLPFINQQYHLARHLAVHHIVQRICSAVEWVRCRNQGFDFTRCKPGEKLLQML